MRHQSNKQQRSLHTNDIIRGYYVDDHAAVHCYHVSDPDLDPFLKIRRAYFLYLEFDILWKTW